MNYFDHAASSTVYPEVVEILTKSQMTDFANPSSQHSLGHDLREKIQECRKGFLSALAAGPHDSFYFTSSATESNNTVVQGMDFQSGDKVLYCPADHPSVTVPIEALKNRYNVELRKITLNRDGSINLSDFELSLDNNVKLVVLSHVNNQSGVIQDLSSLTKLIKEKTQAHVHIDAVQSFGKICFTINSYIDSVAITSHKLGGPKGVAGLFLKKGHAIKPLLLGGGQEEGFRSSTESYPLIMGFYSAMKISLKNLNESKELVSVFKQLVSDSLTKNILGIQTPFENTSPYIFSFILPNIPSDVILRHLEMENVFISSTSACSSKISGFNASLDALNIPPLYHKNFLRISFGPNTRESEVKILIKEFLKIWDNLKYIQRR